MLAHDQQQLRQLELTLERENAQDRVQGARARAHEVYRAIAGHDPPQHQTYARASQNLVAAMMLLRSMPAPSSPAAQLQAQELKKLLETAAVQQAESSASRRRAEASEQRNPPREEREPSVHQVPPP